MCGIIDYVGKGKASKIIIEGLKKLEYRGYDSAGIVTMDPNIMIQKNVGKINDIEFNTEALKGNIGIGHTRWATHGNVTKDNTHPHLSNNKKIVVVHNGIIENYQELKDFLKTGGFSFDTETDTDIDTDKDKDASQEFVVIRFEDHGRGISNDEKVRLFKQFVKSGDMEELDLGLSIVKTTLDRYSGEIAVEDRVKDDYAHGSAFILKLPIFQPLINKKS